MEEYKPLKCLRRLLDYHLRRELVKELNAREFKPINWFKIVLLEFKQSFKTRICYNRGNMYEYIYVLPLHPKVKYYYKHYKDDKYVDTINTYNYSSYLVNGNKQLEYVYDKVKNENEVDIREVIPNGYKAVKTALISCPPGYGLLSERMQKFIRKNIYKKPSVDDKINLSLVRIRVEIGRMDLTKTPVSQYSILTLKNWDKTTKKTSNKGLKADTTYSWSDDYGHRGGWIFEGMKAGILELLCRANGFKIQKGVKYQYGDYAEWYLKL